MADRQPSPVSDTRTASSVGVCGSSPRIDKSLVLSSRIGTCGGDLGASSMRAAGLFRYLFQRRFVGFGEGGGDRTVRLEDRFDEAGCQRARVFDVAIV